MDDLADLSPESILSQLMDWRHSRMGLMSLVSSCKIQRDLITVKSRSQVNRDYSHQLRRGAMSMGQSTNVQRNSFQSSF